MTRLRITEGGRSRVVTISSRRVTLGRSEECDLPLASASASRRHAELVFERGRWTIRDLGSANGTFRGDERVDEAPLEPGDEVALGTDVTLELLSDAPGAYEEAEPLDDDSDREPHGDLEPDDEDDAGADRPRWWQRTQWMLHDVEGETSHRLARRVTTVGRDPGATLVLDDPSVSRMHARFDWDGETLTLTDLHSGNGTYVNDERIRVAKLEPDDRVRFGEAEFQLERGHGPKWGGLMGPYGARVAIALLLALGALSAPVDPARAQAPAKLSIDALRVTGGSKHVLLLRAQDTTGTPVSGLEDRLAVRLDGGDVRALVVRSPFGAQEHATVAVVVDADLLAPSSDDRRATLALLAAIAGALPGDDRVVVIGAGPSLRHLERSASQVHDGEEGFEPIAESGDPRLLDALADAAGRVSGHRVLSSALVVAITRGETRGSRAHAEDVIARALARGGQTSVLVGLVQSGGDPALGAIANATSGAVVRVSGSPSGDDRFATLVRALRMRYELSFEPQAWDANAASHRVEVVLASGGGPVAMRSYTLAQVREATGPGLPAIGLGFLGLLVVIAPVLLLLRPRQLALLVVQGGEDEGVWYEIFALPLSVGSGDEDDIVVAGEGISPNHCLLQRQGRQFVLVDTNSEHGTWVQGERIRRRVLADEDVIRLGTTTELLFEDHR
ncbi:MAG TPA: FHA domain-containing protein [Candidatus Acidoferrales bacterium]|nr:FHA domain-containing protein [Candidatus Acidoferrales bacterium]